MLSSDLVTQLSEDCVYDACLGGMEGDKVLCGAASGLVSHCLEQAYVDITWRSPEFCRKYYIYLTLLRTC